MSVGGITVTLIPNFESEGADNKNVTWSSDETIVTVIVDPGKIGAVMIISEHENVDAANMVKEFDIELHDKLRRTRLQ